MENAGDVVKSLYSGQQLIKLTDVITKVAPFHWVFGACVISKEENAFVKNSLLLKLHPKRSQNCDGPSFVNSFLRNSYTWKLMCVSLRFVFALAPCEQSLLLPFSLPRRGKGGSAWIASTLWSRRSSKFWTSQSCFLSSNWFFQCEHPLSEKTDGYNWARCTMKNQDGGKICLKPCTSYSRRDSS